MMKDMFGIRNLMIMPFQGFLIRIHDIGRYPNALSTAPSGHHC